MKSLVPPVIFKFMIQVASQHRMRTLVCFAVVSLGLPSCSVESEDRVARPTVAVGETTRTDATWVPNFVTVKYRPDQVDVAAPNFEWIGPITSSVVDSAWYDEINQYMVIVLNGTAYQYCAFDAGTWRQFSIAPSLGSFYRKYIRGRFDCRLFPLPTYP